MLRSLFRRPFFRQPLYDVLACMEPLMRSKKPLRSIVPMLIAMTATWIVYVPIHELLHVAGCLVTGGTVTELELKPLYFGRQLAEVFDFVVPKGNYGGRLSGFDTNNSDLCYLATDFAPFLLTVLFGVPLVCYCTKKARAWLFGPAIVLGLAPFYNLPGDYFEMSSIMTTRIVTWLQGGGYPPAYEGVRSDDVFTLIGNLALKPAELGLHSAGDIAIGVFLTILSVPLAILLAFATYRLGTTVARLTIGEPRQPSFVKN